MIVDLSISPVVVLNLPILRCQHNIILLLMKYNCLTLIKIYFDIDAATF